MDDQSSLLNLTYSHQEKGMDELRQPLLLNMELEDARLKAQEELKIRDEQILQLKIMLSKAIKERDEAQDKCQKMMFEKLLLSQQSSSSIEDEPTRAIDSFNGFSSSDCEDSIVSPPPLPRVVVPPPLTQQQPPPQASVELPIMTNKPLPTKGKLLQAVIEAGPLLRTLLVAGPLPQWRHPPPSVDSGQIPAPPLNLIRQESLQSNNCVKIDRKRGLNLPLDPSTESKHQKVGPHGHGYF